MRFLISVRLLFPLAQAQDVQINCQNKTIAVTAEESVTAANVRASESISKVVFAAGVPKSDIETENLRLWRVEQDEKSTPEMRKEGQFEAEQNWHVTLACDEGPMRLMALSGMSRTRWHSRLRLAECPGKGSSHRRSNG